ncbi:hypothetical protein Scep_004800 [Stephania cephalantha]|uniref:Uncharacterized protein n=1 Tax=Stephania cephalantha TaxID=152367 RepID=A0AAP0KT37_9MAGN
MQTTNDTRNSVKEKPKATSGCEGDGADPTCSGGEVSDERQRGGRGVAGLLAAAAGSGRAVARSASLAEQGRGGARRGGARQGRGVQGRGAQRRRWPRSASLAEQGRGGAGLTPAAQGRAGAEQGRGGACRGGARSGVAGRAAAELGEQGRGGARAGAALARDRMQRRGTCPAVVAEGLRRWWRVGSENGFGGEMGLER